MTAPYKAPLWREVGDSQWADYGVNVGHAVYGDIHFHPPASSAARSRRRNTTSHSARMAWHAAVRSALTELARVCGRAAAALAYLRPDEAGKEKT
ncbi:hypothetical protein PJ985_21520 [Streptomyces sp. ACA25]|uniref:hypothetical protein n=1 Tax=Streptomyces sp. ACA25 TaxID=3022596 RepID=UPI0023082F8A|nr:hypothetical protein [Streptomyces sp. ACA25]MDB1090139.1 hypothetical protein [Streptomyces sp. ACA25]